MKIKVGSIKNISRFISKNVWGEGVSAVGDISYRAYNILDPELDNMDCYFQFNVLNPYRKNRKDKEDAYQYIKKSNKPFVVWEEGPFRQYSQYKRVGWWHYQNSKANFNNAEGNKSRWNLIMKETGMQIKKIKSNKRNNILLMGQMNLDSALLPLYESGVKSFYEWVMETVSNIRKYSNRNIVIRPHPFDLLWYQENEIYFTSKFQGVTISKNFSQNQSKISSGGKGLMTDLEEAYCVVTFNSNSGVESILNGIPTFALHETSPVFDVSMHDISKIENLVNDVDIETWGSKIALSVWNSEEIKRGETWAHLKPVYF